MVLTGHVVGHEVDDDLHASLVGALHEVLELLHTGGHAARQVGVDVVVVAYGVW